MNSVAIRLALDQGIARLTIDQPNSRANIMSAPVLAEFRVAIDSIAHQPNITGLIIESAKPGIFIAGADINAFASADPNQPAPTRTYLELGQRVLDLLEALPFPTVAAINGAALGGGLEVALACDFRVCGSNPKLQLGLPEIKLGLIPGWGGTQRLPRLIGVEEAINRILSGESYDESDPPPDDLVDEWTDSDQLVATATCWLATGDWHAVRRCKREAVPAHLLPSSDFLADTRETLDEMDDAMKPAAAEALKVVLEGSISDLPAGLRLETEAFLRLVGTPNSKQMIADFFAKRKR
jgi:enoyl-CoA hydratase/carnithine racemase